MLKGLVSLVTGGASGLGKATVERLVQNGGNVVILDIQGTRAQEVAKTLGENVHVSVGCVTSEEDVKKALDLAKTKFGRLDTLVNCAGFAQTSQVYNFNKDKEAGMDTFVKCVNVNTIGTFNTIRLAAGLIGKNQPTEDGHRGVIINTASTIAYEGDIGQAGYAASTAAIIGMTLPIARDLSSQGIRVMTIAPGLIGKNQPTEDGHRGVIINTASTIAYEGDIGQAGYAASTAAIIGMTLPIARDLSSQGIRVMTIAPGVFDTPLVSYLPEKMLEFIKRMTPFPSRLGKPEEFAHLVTSIIENPMLNGEVIRLDGAQRWFPL